MAENKIKVALDLQPCCIARSGVGSYALELASHLHSGSDVEYQANTFNFMGRNDRSALKQTLSIPMKEHRLFPNRLLDRCGLWNWLDYSAFFGKSDITHFFGYVVPPKIQGKVLNTVYDMVLLRFPETMEQGNHENLKNNLRRSVDRSERLLTISEFSRREIADLLGYPADRIDVVYPAASLSDCCADADATKQKYHITKPYILFVGSIEPRKNLERLVQAYGKLKKEEGIPHQLVLSGGKGWNNEPIFKAIDALPCKEDVICTGYVSSAEKNALYKGAALFAFPSVYEGFGMPPLEAMHWNVPVVCTDAASLPEAAGDAACYVHPDSVDSIAEGLFRVLHDADYAAELVRRGQAQQQKFTWESSAAKLQEIYRAM